MEEKYPAGAFILPTIILAGTLWFVGSKVSDSFAHRPTAEPVVAETKSDVDGSEARHWVTFKPVIGNGEFEPRPTSRTTSHAVVNTNAMILGRVFLAGVPAPERTLPLDPASWKEWKKQFPGRTPMTQFIRTSKLGELADVLIYLEDVPAGDWPKPADDFHVLIKGSIFEPYIAAARTGQTIRFTVVGNLMDNIHPTPRVPGNPEKNLAMLPDSSLRFAWPKPELFLRYKCDVHPWGFAYLSLFDHPFFDVTDARGAFSMHCPPAGKYTLVVYHRKVGMVRQEFEIPREGVVHLRITLPVDGFKSTKLAQIRLAFEP